MINFLQSLDPLYVLSGVLVGGLVGMTGVGGGSLMTPLLILLFGVHPATAVGTDLIYASITKAGGSLVHGYNKTIDWRVVGRLMIGSLPATAATGTQGPFSAATPAPAAAAKSPPSSAAVPHASATTPKSAASTAAMTAVTGATHACPTPRSPKNAQTKTPVESMAAFTARCPRGPRTVATSANPSST